MIINRSHGSDDINDIEKGHPSLDIIVGVVSFANHTSLEDSGIGCVLISDVRDWIESIMHQKVSQFKKRILHKLDHISSFKMVLRKPEIS